MLVFNATQVLEAMDDDEPPLVIEYNGINHYSAYHREGVPPRARWKHPDRWTEAVHKQQGKDSKQL